MLRPPLVHSNIEGEVCNALYAAFDGDACIINPADYTTTQPLRAAISQ